MTLRDITRFLFRRDEGLVLHLAVSGGAVGLLVGFVAFRPLEWRVPAFYYVGRFAVGVLGALIGRAVGFALVWWRPSLNR